MTNREGQPAELREQPCGSDSTPGADSSAFGGAFYARLFDEAVEAICLTEEETGIVRECNRAFLQLTAYTRSELIGRPYFHLLPEDAGPQRIPPVSSDNIFQPRERVCISLVTRSGVRREVEVESGRIEVNGERLVQTFYREVVPSIQIRTERETSLSMVRLLNDRNQIYELIRSLTGLLQKWSGCEAVGIRLRQEDDFPYFETRGFTSEFVKAENSLCMRDAQGQVMRNAAGESLLECMCGNILSGRFDPSLPFFTQRGSFWTNSTTELLADASKVESFGPFRARCMREGYESVALIPLRHGDRMLGLIQLNDRDRGRFTREQILFLENAADQIAIGLAQRQAQEALAASQERYRILFEVESDAIFLVDSETERIIDVNRTALKLYGYTREECLQLKVNDVFVEVDHPQPTLASGEPQPPLRWQRRKDGSIFPVEIDCNFFDYQGRKINVITVRDISERKRVEDRFREQAELLEMALANARMGTWEIKIDDRTATLSNFTPNIFGLEIGKVTRDRSELRSLLHPDDVERVTNTIKQVAKNCEPAVMEIRDYWPDGHLHWHAIYVYPVCDSAGKPVRLVGLSMDITERKQAEEALRESESRYRSIFEQVAIGVCHMALNGKYLRVNRKFCDIIGYSESELVQLNYRDITHADDLQNDLFNDRRLLAGETDNYSVEKRYLRKDGIVIWVNLSESLVRDLSGAPSYFIVAIEDITDRKHAEENIQHSQIQLSHMSRLSTVGEMVAGIAHEVNQPLYSIVNYSKACSNILAHENPSLDKLRTWCREITLAASRAGEIIVRLRRFVRKSETRRLPMDVNKVVDESLKIVAFEIRRRRITVRRQLFEGELLAKIDRIQIQQVIVNLLVNACEALGEKTRGSGQLIVRTAITDEFVEVTVADNGPGLHIPETENIFEPFVTTKPQGLGMGLAISKAIVESHGGRVWAGSNPDGGANFHFTLPLFNGDVLDVQ